MTAADVRACGWIIGMSCLLIGLAMIAGWILGCVADAMRGPADVGPDDEPDDECAWCRPLGSYGDISTLPSQCTCGEGKACEAVWCQRRAVTR